MQRLERSLLGQSVQPSSAGDRWAHHCDSKIIAVDGQAQVVFLSPSAREALVSNQWPIQIHEGRLVFIEPALQRRFLQNVSYITDTPAVHKQVKPTMIPIARNGLVSLISLRWCADSGAVLLALDDPWRPSAEDLALMCEVFGFTRRESEVAGNLARGLSLNTYIDQASITQNTVKTHLKQIFRKADVRSQGQLVAVVRALLC